MEQKIKPEQNEESLIRIMSKDIRGNMSVYSGLTKIKGISWAVSNALCKKLNLNKDKKIASLSKEEIDKINNFLKKGEIPKYLLNRRKDIETGKDSHLVGSDLDLKKEFDIKRLKKIKSYKGYRHLAGQPVRGQRTRSHFRKNKSKGAGIKSKAKRTEK